MPAAETRKGRGLRGSKGVVLSLGMGLSLEGLGGVRGLTRVPVEG
ncbi:hypothetical protein [Streptomyces sp. NPDC101776]